MLDIVFVIIALLGVGGLAQRAGRSPVVWGGVALVGFVVAYTMAIYFYRQQQMEGASIVYFAGWGWMGLIALYVRLGSIPGKE